MFRWPLFRKPQKAAPVDADLPKRAQAEGPATSVEESASCCASPECLEEARLENAYPMACRLARSLETSPEEWSGGDLPYTLVHRDSGYAIWVANNGYRMGERVGHGTSGSYTAEYAKEEVDIIWPAAEKALRRLSEQRASVFFDTPVKVRLWQQTANTSWLCQDIDRQKPWVGVGRTPDEAYRSWLAAAYPRYRDEIMKGRPLMVWRG